MKEVQLVGYCWNMRRLGTTKNWKVILLHSSLEITVEERATLMFWLRKQELGVPPHVE